LEKHGKREVTCRKQRIAKKGLSLKPTKPRGGKRKKKCAKEMGKKADRKKVKSAPLKSRSIFARKKGNHYCRSLPEIASGDLNTENQSDAA